MNSLKRFKIIRAGRRSGKTIFESEDMISDAMAYKNRNVFYIAPTQTQARDIVWLTLRKRLHGNAKFNEQRLEIIVPTLDKGTSMIKLAGWENRENFRGKSAYSVVFDETDTMRDFFVGWHDIFRPSLIDSAGNASFIGTPKKENPNLRRLEKIAEGDPNYACFHFTTFDNPYLPLSEREALIAEYKENREAYQQEILAEHVENAGSLFEYDALIDIFSNTITKENAKYLIVDIADDGTDKTIFSFWEGLEEYKREEFERLNTENIIQKIREFAMEHKIAYSRIAVDAIGVGAGVASSSLLDGIVGFKSSFAPIKTDMNIVYLPNVKYHSNPLIPLSSDYRNLRSQCLFVLSEKVNNHEIASRVQGRQKEVIIEELFTYQDASKGDGKRMATEKDKVKEIIGRSPDVSDCFIMRMYFVIRNKMSPDQSPERTRIVETQKERFAWVKRNRPNNSTR